MCDGLSPNVVFFAVYMMDRFHCEESVDKSKLVILGVSCVTLACTYEYGEVPSLLHPLTKSSKIFEEALATMEVRVRNTLQLNEDLINSPNIWTFFELHCWGYKRAA